MVDLHCHILPGIDDGSASFEESMKIIKKAEKYGVTDISFSPHYIFGSTYDANNETKEELFSDLKEKTKNENIKVNLYLGNEVFVENNMLEMLKNGQVTTINNSKYLLFELPMNNSYRGIYDLIFNLKTSGIEPIIAHPERYLIFKKDPTLIEKMLEQGALFQCNLASFYGHYGKEAKELAILFLKHHAIHFICTDTHHARDEFYENISNVKKILSKYVSDEEIEDLFVNNAKHVLNNEKIREWEFIPFKKGIFKKVK